MADKRHHLSPFSIILIMVALMIIGAAMIPLLSVQLQPAQKSQMLSVSCGWSNASPEVIENELVSKLESVLARIEGIEEMTSISHFGYGQVTLVFKEGTKMDVARFEAASQIRFLYPLLPQGASYPSLSLSTSGETGSSSLILSYTINTSLSGQETEKHITENILPVVSRISGVNNVHYGGILPYEYEIRVDPDAASSAGVTMQQIASAFNNYFEEKTIGNVTYGEGEGNVILLKTRMSSPMDNFMVIPVVNAAGRILYVGDLSRVSYRQVLPSSYSRINGLQTVNMSIVGVKGGNVVHLSGEVKKVMAELEKSFPAGFTVEVNYDAADHINKELRTILLRTWMTLTILLLFVWTVSRNWRYLLIILVTLVANILIAIIFYYLLGLQVHLYSLAGITVSLGIIIDTSIIMVDHYSYYRDRKAFLAILGAILTTIAALSVIFLLPKQHQLIFGDFAWVIIINLSISLSVSLFFIPALLEHFPLKKPMTTAGIRMKKRVISFNRIYARFIGWSKRRKWIFMVVLILGFGLPVHQLPARLTPEKGEETNGWMNIYNKVIGSKFYQEHKAIFEKIAGGSFRLFDTGKPSAGNAYRKPEKISLTIKAGMVEGNTVHQLNEIVRHMENYLSQFDEIENFRTSVLSYDNSTITVTFKPEYEKGGFPYILFENVKREAIKFGGATWSIYGLPDTHFNNNMASYTQYKPHRIALSGYNYDNLLRYAEELRDSLARNRRVSEPGVYGEVRWEASRAKQEYFIDFDREKALLSGVHLSSYFAQLNNLLYNNSMQPVFIDGKIEKISLASSKKNSFDLWHVKNFPIPVDSIKVKLSDFGTINKQYSGLSIYKRNQSYQLIVAFDFIGSYELCARLINRQTKRMNDHVLPIGYMARDNSDHGWYMDAKKNTSFLLILLVIAIIYGVCAVLFESFKKPLIIVLMIPVSFIGVFLTFGLFGFRFDQGGFASFVLLSGLVVNAGIYIINEYNIISAIPAGRMPLKLYLKAYNHKIIPITLTIVSTILGLIPFIINGKDDVFWYSFAIGTMGGMVFSIIAFLIYLPVFLPMKMKNTY